MCLDACPSNVVSRPVRLLFVTLTTPRRSCLTDLQLSHLTSCSTKIVQQAVMEYGGSSGIELGDTGIFIPLPTVIPPNDNAGTALCVITWTLFGVGTIVLAARAFSKIVILKQLALDDILMYLSW